MKEKVVVGKFGATHGVHGWIKVYSYTHPPKNILSFSAWHIAQKKDWQTYYPQENKQQLDHFIVKIKDINTPEQAQTLVNCLIQIERSNLPQTAPGEFYWSDLTGLTVINQAGVVLGKVDYLFSTGANDVMAVIDKDKLERLIPYTKGVILSVDLKKQLINVDWDAEL